jgi:hypothetical protein
MGITVSSVAMYVVPSVAIALLFVAIALLSVAIALIFVAITHLLDATTKKVVCLREKLFIIHIFEIHSIHILVP